MVNTVALFLYLLLGFPLNLNNASVLTRPYVRYALMPRPFSKWVEYFKLRPILVTCAFYTRETKRKHALITKWKTSIQLKVLHVYFVKVTEQVQRQIWHNVIPKLKIHCLLYSFTHHSMHKGNTSLVTQMHCL